MQPRKRHSLVRGEREQCKEHTREADDSLRYLVRRDEQRVRRVEQFRVLSCLVDVVQLDRRQFDLDDDEFSDRFRLQLQKAGNIGPRILQKRKNDLAMLIDLRLQRVAERTVGRHLKVER